MVVVVDSGNERFFQFAFVPTSVTERKKSDETFSRTFLAHIPLGQISIMWVSRHHSEHSSSQKCWWAGKGFFLENQWKHLIQISRWLFEIFITIYWFALHVFSSPNNLWSLKRIRLPPAGIWRQMQIWCICQSFRLVIVLHQGLPEGA